jgi:DHA1 family bicyclomycin/chloramphenicol resistance-like MFS transporter
MPAVTPAVAALVLGLLMGLQPVTTDIYLPALPLLRRELHASMGVAQLTMSALILSFGLAQMVWGPLADRFGRRPILLIGLTLHTAASAACVGATSIEALLLCRILQGVGLASAVVIARAVVRDLFAPEQGAQVMSLAMSVLGVCALIGPLAGGLTAAWGGWRAALALVTAIVATTLALVTWRLPETLPPGHQQPLRIAPLLAAWRRIARDRSFRAWSLLVSASFGGLFLLLASSSFVYIDVLGLSPAAYGFVMALGSLSYIAGTLVCRRWIARHGMRGAVARGGFFTLAAGVLCLAFLLWGVRSVWVVLLPQLLFLFGHGQHQPCAQAGVVAPFPRSAGAAAALSGLLLALVAFAIGRWLGVALDGTLQSILAGLAFWSAATCVVAWVLVPRALR